MRKTRDTDLCNATIHCEAALASLAKYANDMPIQHAQDHPGVVGCLQVSFTVVIGKFINLTEEQNIEPKYNRCVQRVGKSWTAWKAPTTDSVSVAAILRFLPFMQVENVAAVAVGILRAVGREGRNARLSHYHETSGLAQTREVSVNTHGRPQWI